MMDDEPERMDPRCDAGGRGYMLWMEYCNDGEYVRATDYDALAAKLAAAEQRERQLLDTTATCRMLRREFNTLKAKLAEVEAERDAFASNIPDAAQNLIRNAHTGRLKALHRAKAAEARIAHLENHIEAVAKDTHKIMVAAEAALASMQSDALAFVLFLDENYRHSFGDIAREKIRAFYARIQKREKK